MVIERSADDVAAHEQRGYAYRSLGKYPEAVADFTKVIEARPKDAEAYRRRGLTYRLMQDYAKAADDFRTLLQLKPNDADAQSRLNYVEAKLYSVHPELFTPIPHQAAEEAARSVHAGAKGEKQRQRQPSPTPTPSPAE
jgi:tetratricopeptide (TPR) repeat protein